MEDGERRKQRVAEGGRRIRKVTEDERRAQSVAELERRTFVVWLEAEWFDHWTAMSHQLEIQPVTMKTQRRMKYSDMRAIRGR